MLYSIIYVVYDNMLHHVIIINDTEAYYIETYYIYYNYNLFKETLELYLLSVPSSTGGHKSHGGNGRQQRPDHAHRFSPGSTNLVL